MAQPPANLTREHVASLVEEARVQKKSKKAHVRARIEEQFPQYVGMTVRRNGRSYDAIDLLISDVDSY